MPFVSIEFALFVTAALILYYIVPAKYRYLVLLVASYVFYTLSDAFYLFYILFTTVSVFVCAALIENKAKKLSKHLLANKETLSKDEKKACKLAVKRKQKIILFVCVILNFGILTLVKYFNPFLTSVSNLGIAYFNMFRLNMLGTDDFVPFKNFIMPLGISFYTFQSMGYLIDIYYGKYEREHNFLKFALFVSFFPQIIQGPISRFGELSKELYRAVPFDFDNIRSGFYRVMWGLFKKLIVADRLGGYISATISMKENYKGIYILLALFFYSMQLYGDFSGGIDVALGVAEMFGIKLAENFERPFFSKSITEYWQRWHITLGTWFKDYIFYPLSVNKSMIKLGKFVREKGLPGLGKRIPIYLPMFAVWIVTGMWHGSTGKFVVWGLCNFVFIVLGTEAEPLSKKIIARIGLDERSLPLKIYRVSKTFLLMSFLRIFDISHDTKAAFCAFRYAFLDWGAFKWDKVYTDLLLPKEDLVVALIAIAVMFIFSMIQRSGSVRKRIFALPVPAQWVILSLLIVAVSVFGYYGMGYDAASFIYGNI